MSSGCSATSSDEPEERSFLSGPSTYSGSASRSLASGRTTRATSRREPCDGDGALVIRPRKPWASCSAPVLPFCSLTRRCLRS